MPTGPTLDTTRPISLQLLDLSLPVIGLNVLQILALVIDTAMCGRLENAEHALTSLGFASQIIFLLMVAMMGLTIGTVAIVARAYGGGDQERVNHVLVQSTQLTVILGVAVGLVFNLLAPEILRGLGADGTIVDEALGYLRPLLWATPFYYLVTLYAGVLRGVGNTRLPFMVSLVANVINVALNYGLILGNWGFPALGMPGAAYGTIASQVFSVVAMVLLIRRDAVPGLQVPFRLAPIDKELARTLFRIGAPAAADMVILNAAFLSIVGMLGRLDSVAVAAHGIGLRIQALAFLPGLGVSQATAAMVGQALGGGAVERARSIVKSSVVLTTTIMTSLSVVIFAFEKQILAAFDVAEGSRLESLTITWMNLLGLGFPVVGSYVALVGMLQGAGDTRTSLRINMWSTLALQIPLSWLLGFPLGYGEAGVWAAFPIAFVAKALLGGLAYRRGTWAKVGAQA